MPLRESIKTFFFSQEFIIPQTWMVRNQNVKEQVSDCSAWDFYWCL